VTVQEFIETVSDYADDDSTILLHHVREKLAELLKAERERCARVVEVGVPSDYGYGQLTRVIAARIESLQDAADRIRALT